MNKIVSLLIALAITVSITGFCTAEAANRKSSKSSGIPANVRPYVAKYRAGNYIGAMQDLEEFIKVNENNSYAKYYLALCYTRLGYKNKAHGLYDEISHDTQYPAIAFYSQRAAVCLDNPADPRCNPPKLPDAKQKEVDDITAFLQSGRMIHPSAMDKITRDRMERRIQNEEYLKRQEEMNQQFGDENSDFDGNNANSQQPNPNSKASIPTNEEIVYALDTLSKAGINPYDINSLNRQLLQTGGRDMLGLNNINDYSNAFFANSNNPDLAQMILYSQLTNQNNFGQYIGL